MNKFNPLLQHEHVMTQAGTKTIPLYSKGQSVAYALVDDDDYEWLSKFRFNPIKKERNTDKLYVKTSCRSHNGKQEYLHRLIMRHHHGNIDGQIVDHIDGNPLNNRKLNLRLTDGHGNARNMCPQEGREYKGVRPQGKRFGSYIATKAGGQITVGHFDTVRQAAIAYDIKAIEMFGEYACLNIPDVSEREIEEVKALILNPKKLPGKSQYRGVTKCKYSGWIAQISINNVTRKIGRYPTELEAARAYNEAAIKYRGSKAKLNILPT